MHINSLEQALANEMPSSVNNSRGIIRAAITRFKRNPCERYANEVERMTGVSADISDADTGNGPRGDNN